MHTVAADALAVRWVAGDRYDTVKAALAKAEAAAAAANQAAAAATAAAAGATKQEEEAGVGQDHGDTAAAAEASVATLRQELAEERGKVRVLR
eukprot:COSAG01_NODE_6678_length_3549_cov_23.615362_7_plen_93_part_00